MYFLGKAQKPLIEFRLSVADLDIRKTYNTYMSGTFFLHRKRRGMSVEQGMNKNGVKNDTKIFQSRPILLNSLRIFLFICIFKKSENFETLSVVIYPVFPYTTLVLSR